MPLKHPHMIFRPEDEIPDKEEAAREANRESVTLIMCPCCRGRGMVTPEHGERCHVDPIRRTEPPP